MHHLDDSDDTLVTGLPEGAGADFFDRFYFNLHGDSPTPLVMIGAGVYPGAGLTDGYVLVVDGTEQHNLRFSTEQSGPVGGVGPLTWQVVEPLRRWALQLGPNPLGVELDVEWTARTQPWKTDDIVVDNGRGGRSEFGHFFQSGRYEGALVVGGEKHDVSGWLGQRDRSRGVRVVAGGQGLHLWVQAQFDDHCVAFIMDESRQHDVVMLDGAVLHVDGTTDPIVDVGHDLHLDDGLDLLDGVLTARTASGRRLAISVDGSAGGGFLSGGGYGGWHGRPHGSDHVEHDSYPLNGTVSPRTLDMPLTDRPATFAVDGQKGVGVCEFAVTRSSTYRYAPRV